MSDRQNTTTNGDKIKIKKNLFVGFRYEYESIKIMLSPDLGDLLHILFDISDNISDKDLTILGNSLACKYVYDFHGLGIKASMTYCSQICILIIASEIIDSVV